MSRARWLTYRYAVLFVLPLAVPLSAQQLGPLDTLKDRDHRIRQILGPGDRPLSADEERRLRDLVNGSFDYQAHAEAALGRYWTQAGPSERDEAVRLISFLLERSAMEKVRKLGSEHVEYLRETPHPVNSSAFLVQTRVKRGQESWSVVYSMKRTERGWKIVDVIIEGASTIDSNRAAFYKEIKASGIEGLLRRLRSKAVQGGSG